MNSYNLIQIIFLQDVCSAVCEEPFQHNFTEMYNNFMFWPIGKQIHTISLTEYFLQNFCSAERVRNSFSTISLQFITILVLVLLNW